MSDRSLQILVLSSRFPYPPRWGFATRVYQLARRLASRHEVTLLSYGDASDEESAERLRAEIGVEIIRRAPRSLAAKRAQQVASLASTSPFDRSSAYSGEMQAAIDRLCAARRFDAVQMESPLLWGYRFPPRLPVVLDEHNIEYEVFARMREAERSPLRRSFYRLEQVRFRRFERRSWREIAGCAVTSEREADIVRAHAPRTPVAVVPNGVDLDYFRPGGEFEPRAMVFNGVLDYRPNLDAAEFLVEEVLPLVRAASPHARLTIVGRGSPADLEAFRRRGVDVVGEVPDIRPYLRRAAVVVVPIRMGGGTRLKVVEGLAMGKPIVSTTLGCEGVAVVDGEHLLVGDTPEEFARQVLRVFEDPAGAAALGRAGRALVERHYSWDSAAARLEELYREVTPESSGRAVDGGAGTRVPVA